MTLNPGTSMRSTSLNWKNHLGTVGYLALFCSAIVTVIVAPIQRLPWIAFGYILVAWLVYPRVFHSLIRLRWLVMIILLSLPPVFFTGQIDSSLAGIPYSTEGLHNGISIALRILVIFISVQALTSSVDISSIAGIFEHAGLHGLGFSFGVALNLLPSLQLSAQNAWRSLWLRGGLRKDRLHAIRCLSVTIIANALNRAEEIALAAEVRAFSPSHTYSMPIKVGKWDWIILVVSGLVNLAIILVP
jgi:energy-coupling factor transporter transmembrane protein EcfT